MRIQLASSDDEIARCFPVLLELRPKLVEASFTARVRELQAGGYELAFVEDDDDVRAVAGFRIGDMLHRGVHMYVDDLVTRAEVRSKGYGAALLRWLVDLARSRGCGEIHLDSGMQREAAHRFYTREGFDITSYHFKRSL